MRAEADVTHTPHQLISRGRDECGISMRALCCSRGRILRSGKQWLLDVTHVGQKQLPQHSAAQVCHVYFARVKHMMQDYVCAVSGSLCEHAAASLVRGGTLRGIKGPVHLSVLANMIRYVGMPL